jgi:hypothetical protein
VHPGAVPREGPDMSKFLARLFGSRPAHGNARPSRRWFRRDPTTKLRRQHLQLLEQARDLQRSGDIRGFAAMTERAEAVSRQIDEFEQRNA